MESTNRTAPTESTHTSSSVPVTSTPETITTSSPAPTHGDWKVVDPKTNITCIRIKGDLQVNFIHGNSSVSNISINKRSKYIGKIFLLIFSIEIFNRITRILL